MKKRAATLLLMFIFLISLLAFNILAADNESDSEVLDSASSEPYDKAYDCLEEKLGDSCGNAGSTEQISFSLLGIGYDSGLQSDCLDALNDLKKTSCWAAASSGSCDLKSTSQAVIALNHVGKNTEDYVKWILDKRKQTAGLTWFLEIDTNEASSCKIKVNGGSERTFTISENKKISGTSSCLNPAENSYFLKISDSCLASNFTISCDKDFITTILYKKSSGSAYYVSSLTNSAPASGSTEEKVNAYCFGINSCDYEGSLWATIALAKTGKDVSPYLPYLSSAYDEAGNKGFFPSAFLYMLTDEDDYQAEITGKQKQGKYWDESGNRFYDTALALLSLQNLLIDEVSSAKDYLLEIQDSSGCWHSNNIKDTSFILYAAWPRSPVISGDGGGRSMCRDFGYYCVAPGECSLSHTLDNFYCSGLSNVCCKTEPLELSCKDKGGVVCEDGQECTGSEVTASDTFNCCLDSCIEVSAQTECEQYSNVCRTRCLDNEEEKLTYDCNFGDVCCARKESKGGWTLIILLVILIVLVVLAIIFRNQLKVWWFRMKSGLKFGKPPAGPSGRPPMNPPGFLTQRPRQIIPREAVPVRRPMMRKIPQSPSPKKTEKDSLFDETMKKLKEMAG